MCRKRSSRPRRRGKLITAVSGTPSVRSQYTFQERPARLTVSMRLKIVSASFCLTHFPYGSLLTTPEEDAAWKKERLGKVSLGTAQCQWSNTVNCRASVL